MNIGGANVEKDEVADSFYFNVVQNQIFYDTDRKVIGVF
jgi:hypothetical protein